MYAGVGEEVREDLAQRGLVAEDENVRGVAELPRVVGGDHVRVGQGVQYQRDNVDCVPFERPVSVQARQGQHLLHEGRHARPLRGDALEGLGAGGLVNVAARELRIPLHGGERRAQLVGGVCDELTQLRFAAGAALHAVFDRVDHRVEGARDVGDLHGARGRLLADARQIRRLIGEVAARDVRGRRAHHAEGTQLATHPHATDHPRGERDDQGCPHLDGDKHDDDVVDAVRLHADQDGLVLDHAGGDAERAQPLKAHGVRHTIGGHMRQDLQRALIQVLHREVGDDRTGRLTVLAHVLEGALRDSGTSEPGPRGTAGDDRPAGARRPRGLCGRAGGGVIVGALPVLLVLAILRRVIDIEVLACLIGEAVQLGVHVGQHPGAHDQGGGRHHDDEGQGDARGERAGQAPGQGGAAARHCGSRMM